MVGEWDGHGRSIVITRAGRFDLSYRTYVECTSTVRTGCDRAKGDTVEDGGYVRGYVSHVRNSTTVTITVVSSTVPKDFPRGPFLLGLDRGHDALAPISGAWKGLPFCGSDSPVGYCGA